MRARTATRDRKVCSQPPSFLSHILSHFHLITSKRLARENEKKSIGTSVGPDSLRVTFRVNTMKWPWEDPPAVLHPSPLSPAARAETMSSWSRKNTQDPLDRAPLFVHFDTGAACVYVSYWVLLLPSFYKRENQAQRGAILHLLIQLMNIEQLLRSRPSSYGHELKSSLLGKLHFNGVDMQKQKCTSSKVV